MNKDNFNVLYVGINGFPNGLASVERQKLIAKSLVESGSSVTILCHNGIHHKNKIKLAPRGTIHNIHYIYTTGSPYRHPSFLMRNLLKIKGIINEFFTIVKLNSDRKIDFIYFANRRYWYLGMYRFLSRLLKFKIIIEYVELGSAWGNAGLKYQKFDDYSLHKADGVICISNYLMQHASQINPSLPSLKVPVVCDIQQIDSVKIPAPDTNYFLFCGSLFYYEVIQFVIDAFERCNNQNYQLYLVANGWDHEKEKLESYISSHSKKTMIRTFSELKRNELIGLLKGAAALLIPLRPIVQDIARFPHKVGEYTASERPVISTNYGEMAIYFSDQINALVATDYSTESYAEKMDFIVQNPEKATQIGLNGKKIAVNEFDYKRNGTKITQFLASLVK